ncbi:MAG: tRNA pseudouridine(38-40) synthase TruA [Candidatus Omnitrophota bacterium]
MRNLKLKIEYDGTNYCGWQVQRNIRQSIQATIEKALQKILQEKVRLIASGRTDAGVHAQAQIANFKTKSGIDLKKLQGALNGLLPADVVISGIEEKGLDFHSRFDAKSKIYRYTILNRPYPAALLRNTVYFYPFPLDITIMRKEARVLLGRHDFSSFRASSKLERGPVRTIKSIKITKDKDSIYMDIEGDGFLYNMVRNIAGTLIESGRGKLPEGSIKKILSAKDRRSAGPAAPARGLCLVKVKY